MPVTGGGDTPSSPEAVAETYLGMLDAHGHTKGQVAILIPEERVLIAGDSCNSFVFLFLQEVTTVKEYKEMLEEMRRKTNGSYDRVLVCHGSGNIVYNGVATV